jgi:hypothetical protein
MHTKLWTENVNRRENSEDLGVVRKKLLEWILEKYGGKAWTGFIWLKIGNSGGLL